MTKSLPGIFFMLAIVFETAGWGPTGHRVTGQVAEKYLSKKAHHALQKILNGQSLAIASTWMDEVRADPRYDYMEDWHWVTIPSGETYQSAPKNPDGDLIKTFGWVMRELKNKKLPPAKQAEYLRILIHVVGDIHQPLHVGSRDDHGGNDVKVKWFRRHSNLHRIWDSDMIDDSRLSYMELAESLDNPSAAQIRTWQKADVDAWVRESQSYEAQVYDYGDGKLGYGYAYLNYPVVRTRLLQAGVRLAGILNELYG